ncbi:Zn-dependent hydrolase [Sporosarcina sp. P33]|uniref:Zn-dependent hydrolase n=1 Tax=Sporosarcina sp. P33 TaxID=1930764 RepID=UPI0009BFB956|nr:Zn-dependent hydrolase [Sporosarcina sp. P33]ARD49020.1 Zn-dependent hydrolase [Sporosarcina sp. P33]
MGSNIKMNTERIKGDISILANIVDQDRPLYTRRPFTGEYLKSRKWLKEEMEKAGLTVSVDAASNLIGERKGSRPELPPIMIGSHTDSVVGGGRFDGIIGVLGGIEIARQLDEQDVRLEHTLLIVDFTAEEASEFGISTIGSRGMVGNLNKEILERVNHDGITLREGLEQLGGRPSELEKEKKKNGDISLYLELHIEQGPVLEQTGHELGAVTGIVGIRRYKVTCHGQANHAGTTPMNMRADALAAASEVILSIEYVANQSYSTQIVGTVGRLFVEPNASNVVPGKVVFDFELRSLESDVLDEAIENIGQSIDSIAVKRTLDITIEPLSVSDGIIINEDVVEGVFHSCQEVGSSLRLPSGAGHDANQIASIAPVGMVFVPSQNGVSHSSDEWTDYELVTKGIQALWNTLIYFDKQFK